MVSGPQFEKRWSKLTKKRLDTNYIQNPTSTHFNSYLKTACGNYVTCELFEDVITDAVTGTKKQEF